MSRYAQQPLDFANLKTVSLQERGGKVGVADFAAPYQSGSGIAGLLDSLPHLLAADSFRAVLDALAGARERRRAILWGMGGHVIKCGLAPVLLDLMRRGYATGFVWNGSAAIHDFEIALAGRTSEEVEAVLPDGTIWNGLRRLRKDNTGYCLRQLFVGSEGTLGVITAAVLKLVARPREVVVAAYPELRQAARAPLRFPACAATG